LIRRYIDVQELCAEHKLRKHHGESVALLVLIDLLADATPALTVTEAGLILSIPAATAVRKLRELAEAGLLEVHQSPTDKRRLHPLLTSMGKFFLRRYENLMGSTVDGSHLPRRRQIHRPRSERRFVDLEVSLPSERGART
jgi:DNA-binding MarR family transcriptional regulator